MNIQNPRYRNSAGRLLAVLESIPSNAPILENLPKLFGLFPQNDEKAKTTHELLAQVSDLYIQFRQDMAEAVMTETQRKTLINGISGIHESIYPINLSGVFRGLTGAEKALLEMCATFITEEDELTESDLELLRESIADLRKLIERSDIPSSLRKILLDMVRISEDTISRFKIHGARGLRTAFKRMLGEMTELYASWSPMDQQEKDVKETVLQVILRHVKIFDAISSKLLKYQPVLTAGFQALLGVSQTL